MLCFRQAVAVNRHAVVAQSHLGEVLSSLRLRNDAISAWRAALSMQPRHVPSLLAIADELRRSSAYADAVAFYRRALEVEANHPEARMGLALATIGSGDAQGFADIATLIANGSARVARGMSFSDWAWLRRRRRHGRSFRADRSLARRYCTA
jgi:tetratricopeptide (TPR) repeat protein